LPIGVVDRRPWVALIWVWVAFRLDACFHNSLSHKHLSILRWVRLVRALLGTVHSMPVAVISVSSRTGRGGSLSTSITCGVIGRRAIAERAPREDRRSKIEVRRSGDADCRFVRDANRRPAEKIDFQPRARHSRDFRPSPSPNIRLADALFVNPFQKERCFLGV